MLGKLALLVSIKPSSMQWQKIIKVSVSLKTQKKIMLFVKSILRYLELKAHKEILFQIFSLPVFFCAYVYVIPLTK